MDKIMVFSAAFLLVFAIMAIVWIIVKASEPGGLFHGYWIERNDPHDCQHPYYFLGALGNTWRCRKCRQIWIKNRLEWERMN